MSATDHSLKMIEVAALAAADKKAQNLKVFDVSEQLAITDAFVIASASNDRMVKAIAENIEDELRAQMDLKPIRREGHREGRWVLLDYGDIVVHVQHEEEHEFYALGRLWRDCPEIPLPAGAERPVEASEEAAAPAVAEAPATTES